MAGHWLPPKARFRRKPCAPFLPTARWSRIRCSRRYRKSDEPFLGALLHDPRVDLLRSYGHSAHSMNNPKLTIGLPSGSLMEQTLALFGKAGFVISGASRSYRPSVDDPELEIRLLRAQEISRYV